SRGRRRSSESRRRAANAPLRSGVNALERSLRSRNRLLEEPAPDPHWLDAVEHETAEIAVAAAAARAETVRRLAAALATDKDTASPFPRAGIALAGVIENAVRASAAFELQHLYLPPFRP